jgi:hypothetical protein
MTRLTIASVLTIWLATAPGLAAAADPKFEYGKKEDVKKVEWLASAQAGMVMTSGNSRTTTISAGATASRKAGDNKLAVEANAAYVKNDILVAVDVNGDGRISENEIATAESTTSEFWAIKARYDRFFTEHNSGYVTAKLSADEPAGKDLVAGGQIGYSRQLYKSGMHELLAEAGYDFSHEDYVTPDASGDDTVQIHSLRVFAGYNATLSSSTTVNLALEALINLNEEETPTGTIDPLDDTRFTGKISVASKLTDDVSLRFGFTARYDSAPAARAPFGLPYADGFLPLADKLDTTTELAVIVNLL